MLVVAVTVPNEFPSGLHRPLTSLALVTTLAGASGMELQSIKPTDCDQTPLQTGSFLMAVIWQRGSICATTNRVEMMESNAVVFLALVPVADAATLHL